MPEARPKKGRGSGVDMSRVLMMPCVLAGHRQAPGGTQIELARTGTTLGPRRPL
jgi:hypothetical protein